MIESTSKRSAFNTTGYQMVDTIRIQNFRSFKEVTIDDCRRVNIVIGENGSGKTVLLEALFLVAGLTPELAMRTRTWRGFDGGRMSGSIEDLHQALWADLFHKFKTDKPAFISLRGKDDENRSVTVKLFRRGHVRVVPPRRKRSGAPVRVVPDPTPIEFKWKIQGHPDVRVAPNFVGNKLAFPPTPATPVKAAFFAANQVPPGLEMANRFSALSRTFREKEFISNFSELFENIKSLSVEVTAGAPMLFAEVDDLPEKIPLSLASGGMSRLAGILLAMPEQAGGVVLVDEIENGFYHKRLPMVWKSLWKFSVANECQLFVSSHSAECLGSGPVK